jgi:GT2 family glycosyltransferase
MGLTPSPARSAPWTRSRTSPPSLAASWCTRRARRTFPPGAIPPSLLPRAAESFDTTTFVGAGHAIRRADFEAAGGYDDALFFCWEEYDFSLRAINMGRRIRYRGDIAVRHKVSGEHRFAWSGTRWFHFVRNRIYIEMKYGASSPSLLPRFLAYQVKGARNGVLVQGLRAARPPCD